MEEIYQYGFHCSRCEKNLSDQPGNVCCQPMIQGKKGIIYIDAETDIMYCREYKEKRHD